MPVDQTIKAALNLIGKQIVAEFQNALESEGKIATKNSYISLDYEITNEGFIKITGNDALQFINDGRKAGTFPNLQNIQEWVAFRGINIEIDGRMLDDEQAAFVIARSIARNGIAPTNIFDRAFERIAPTIYNDMVNVYYEWSIDKIQ